MFGDHGYHRSIQMKRKQWTFFKIMTEFTLCLFFSKCGYLKIPCYEEPNSFNPYLARSKGANKTTIILNQKGFMVFLYDF